MSLSDKPLLLRNSALRSGVVFCTSASWRNFLACSSVSSRDVVCSAAGSAAGCASGCAGGAASTFCSLSLSVSPIAVDLVVIKKLRFERWGQSFGERWKKLDVVEPDRDWQLGTCDGLHSAEARLTKAGSRGAWGFWPERLRGGWGQLHGSPTNPRPSWGHDSAQWPWRGETATALWIELPDSGVVLCCVDSTSKDAGLLRQAFAPHIFFYLYLYSFLSVIFSHLYHSQLPKGAWVCQFTPCRQRTPLNRPPNHLGPDGHHRRYPNLALRGVFIQHHRSEC